MAKWNVDIQDSARYFDVEAETAEEAVEIALEWFSERSPFIICEEVKDNEKDSES